MSWKSLGLRARLLIAVVLLQTVAMALLIPSTVRLVDGMAGQLNEQREDETIPLLVEALARPLFQRDVDTLNRLITGMVARYGLADVRIFDESGQILVQAMASDGPGDAIPPGAGELIRRPIELAGQPIGMVHLRVSTERTVAARHQAIREGIIAFSLQMAGSVVVLAIIAFLLTRNLGTLRIAALAAAQGDLSVRVQPRGGDEVAQTVAAFNSLMDSLQRAEAARQESEERFQQFTEASADWVWETDKEDRITYVSPGHTRMRGEPTSPYTGVRREEMALDLDDTEKWDRYRRAIAEHKPFRDFVFLRKAMDGGEDWLRISGVPVFDAQGVFRGYRGTTTNVTDEMRMQAALEASEQRFRSLVEGSLQAVFIISRERRALFANQAAADIFGYSSGQELMDLENVNVLLSQEERARMDEYSAARLSGQPRPKRYVHKGLHRSGRLLWLETFVNVVDWGGTPAVQSTLVDITEHKLIEEELRRSEQKFRRLVESTALPTLISDKDWGARFVNQASADLFGYGTPEAMLLSLKTGRLLVHEDDRERLKRYREERFAGREVPQRYEFRAIRLDGSTIWLENIVTLVEWEGRPAILSIGLDVTEHKRREEELRQAQKMEVVGQLTGGVAHDFNNLLTVIIGNIELLRRHTKGEGKAGNLLDTVGRAAERGANLTQRLLAFSRKQALRPKPVDINRLVSGMVEVLRRTLGEMIQVKTSLQPTLWHAQVDPNQLENALLNLAINARDAMPEGGELVIETSNARLDENDVQLHQEVRPGQYVQLTVRDTGVGMTADILERAFDPFFTTKEVGRGSGLGLSMIYGFIRQSEGHIRITSEPGKGTLVCVHLPRVPESDFASSAQSEAPAMPSGRGETIVVVEDDRAVRELARALLSSLGYNTIPAADGAAALALLSRHPDTALLFTDVVLGGTMSGVELAKVAKSRMPRLKVLYTSGYTEDDMAHNGYSMEGIDLLEKPFRIEALAQKVRDVLSSH